jgi:hypothetical protein
MIISDSIARLLLIVHTVIAVAAVAAATHLLIWLRHSIATSDARTFSASKRFATIAVGLHFTAFIIGSVMYPNYKLRVRMAYLENPVAVSTDYQQRMTDRNRVESTTENPPDRVRAASNMARWFDVKEHVVAFGLFALAAVWLITRRWRPSTDEHSDVIAPVVIALTGFAVATLWCAGIIGLLTAAWRAI